MSSMLDVIGAVAIGGLVLLTILNSMYNIQSYSINMQFLLGLTQMSERAIDILDTHILANVGSHPATRLANNVFPDLNDLESDKFRFRGEIDRFGTGLQDTDITIAVDNDRLIVYLDNDINTIYAGPFQLKEYDPTDPDDWPGLIISYLDANNVPMDPTDPINFDITNLYGISLDITFEVDGVPMDWGSSLRYRITIWKYFKNLYL